MNAWPAILTSLSSGTDLDRATATDALSDILRGDVDDATITSFLTALTNKGETADEMIGFVDALMAFADRFAVDDGAMDIVGTGGDQLHTVNISTMAALTVAACGVPVCKHGNRAASSTVGTADVLEGLGVRVDVDGATVARCVREAGMGFCFAQRFHPGLRHLGPIRRQLGFPTVFNVLGPLANPAGVKRLLVGVANAAMTDRMARVLQSRGVERALLVHGHDGLDELSLGAITDVVNVTPTEILTSTLDAEAALGVRHSVSALRGGDLAVNVHVIQDYVRGRDGAVFDAATANAGLALVVAGRAATLKEGTKLAAAAVREGLAANVLAEMVRVSNR
jgi:anthranilate phosphoribosyltransferase